MKKVISLMIAAFLLVAASNCILTDKIVAPSGSKKGSDIKADVNNAAMMGYIIGSAGSGLSVDSNALQGSLMSGTVAQATASIKDDQYYTGSSADDCVSGVQTLSTLISYAVWHSSNSMVAACISGSSYNISCIYNTVGTITGLTASGACNLKETGKVINLGDKIKI